MSLEKLGLILFVKYIKQMEVVKKHVSNSVRELFLAASSTLKITQDMTQDNFLLRNFSTIDFLYKKSQSIINYALETLDNNDNQPTPKIKEEKLKTNVLESLITVIDEEIDILTTSDSNNNDMKIEALKTVKTVLTSQLKTSTTHNLHELLDLEKAANE